MKLEKYLVKGKKKYSFDTEINNSIVDTIDLFRQLDEKIKKPPSEAEKAHLSYSIVKTIVNELTDIAIQHAESEGIKHVGLTGGVSYNLPITEMVEKRVEEKGLALAVHTTIPNGDGGISVGQNAIVGHRLSS
jgi:hydrogenase maturation protein HypF